MKQEKINRFQNSWNTAKVKLWAFLLTTVLLFTTSCRKELKPETTNGNDLDLRLKQDRARKAPIIVVQPGSSIQAAITSAVKGTIIKIKPGTYRESLIVDKPDISIIGDGNVVIQNPGGASIGITVKKGANGFTLSGVTVQGFDDRAVEIKEINGFLLSHVTAIGYEKEEFGLFVQYCSNGRIEHCQATGHTDTGIFIGESTTISVFENKSYANTIGIETENASRITIEKNHTYNNTAGILCLLVPGKLVSESSNIIITKNQIRDNNHKNLQKDPAEVEYILPSGIGILVLGANSMIIEGNHVTGNQYTGIAVASTAMLGPTPGIDPVPDNVRVISNEVKNNGFNPQSVYFPTYFASDLLWLGPAIDAAGSGNCWSRNVYNTSFPSSLPSCQ